MVSREVESDWTVRWVPSSPDGDEYLDYLVLNREQAIEYGDPLIQSLRVDETALRKWGLDPDEPFAWKIEDETILTKHISEEAFRKVAKSDRNDSDYAIGVLEFRLKRELQKLKENY